jgi:hypothetical protein
LQNVEDAMTLLLAVLALGSLLAAFWFVGAHVGTDPTSRQRRRIVDRVDR